MNHLKLAFRSLGRTPQFRLVLLGTGLLGAFGLSRLVATILPSMQTSNEAVLSFAILLLVGIATAACYLPARRAARIDPMVALRNE